jgi:hypothetical protein
MTTVLGRMSTGVPAIRIDATPVDAARASRHRRPQTAGARPKTGVCAAILTERDIVVRALAELEAEPARLAPGIEHLVAEDNFERFTPWQAEVHAVGADRVVAVGGISFRARESGVDMAERMGWVFEFRNGQLRRMRFYGSPSEALEAVGLRG